MLFLSILVSLAFSAVAVAQTPDGFVPAVQTPLSAVFPRNITVSPAGVLLQKADTQVQPSITAPVGTPAGNFILFMIDLDVVINGSSVTLLHWLQADFTLSSNRVLTARSANASTGAPYIGPAPPPDGVHRYTLLLFAQPSGFAIPAPFKAINPPADIPARIGFNITQFAAAAGLGRPLAGTYFRVVNNSATASSTGRPAQTSPAQYTGGSSTLNSFLGTELGLAILLVGMAASLFAV